MRLKEDSSSWKASNIIRKVLEPPKRFQWHAKKNTRRWCKGRVGREHDAQMVQLDTTYYAQDGGWPDDDWKWITWKCTACGKKWHQWFERHP